MWGIMTAIFGLVALGYFILQGSFIGQSLSSADGQPVPKLSSLELIFSVTGRFSFVILIETVAFFFLRQYRATILSGAYLTNEITNVRLRLLALTAAAHSGNNEAITSILKDIAKTERNFVLQKDQKSIFHSAAGSDMLPASVISDVLEKVMPYLQRNKSEDKDKSTE